MSTVIKVENLSKLYQLGQVGTGTMSNDLKRWWHRVRGKEDPFLKIGEENDRTKKSNSDFVWALQDINFNVKDGEVLGIIGRNGAGKSTLLKILSRTTAPTTGAVKIKGRIASLLEVGTGFHPELSGRQNVYLNGAILGMTKAEIKTKFDEIVDFSGVERYIDTPVKRYSSGMYVRLAFGVAAHLEPEILIVDEVLAVGDAEFQKKCLGKMKDVSVNGGRTVIFVSHNMGAISQLCTQTIMMQNGRLITMGKTDKVIDEYLNKADDKILKIDRQELLKGNHFQSIIMCDENGNEKMNFKHDDAICIRLKLILPEFNSALELAMRLIDRHKKGVCTIHERLDKYLDEKKSISIFITIPKLFLTPGDYSWIMCINHPGVIGHDMQTDILPFTIIETGSEFARYEGNDYGNVFAQYTITKINE